MRFCMRFCFIRTKVLSSTPSTDTIMASRMNGYGSNLFTPGRAPVLIRNQATNHTMWRNTKVMLPEKPPITSAMRSTIVRCSSRPVCIWAIERIFATMDFGGETASLAISFRCSGFNNTGSNCISCIAASSAVSTSVISGSVPAERERACLRGRFEREQAADPRLSYAVWQLHPSKPGSPADRTLQRMPGCAAVPPRDEAFLVYQVRGTPVPRMLRTGLRLRPLSNS